MEIFFAQLIVGVTSSTWTFFLRPNGKPKSEQRGTRTCEICIVHTCTQVCMCHVCTSTISTLKWLRGTAQGSIISFHAFQLPFRPLSATVPRLIALNNAPVTCVPFRLVSVWIKVDSHCALNRYILFSKRANEKLGSVYTFKEAYTIHHFCNNYKNVFNCSVSGGTIFEFNEVDVDARGKNSDGVIFINSKLGTV